MKGQEHERLSIAEIARLASVTTRTVRYYVAEGLLPPPAGAGQQRTYSAEHVVRLRAIRSLKEGFLPLAEIRRCLSTLTGSDLERLAGDGPMAPTSTPLDRLSSVLPYVSHARDAESGGKARPGPATEARRMPSFVASTAPVGRDVAVPRSSTTFVERQAGASEESVWRRITLAPGVELHVQPSGDRRRDELIAHIIRTAAHLLGQTTSV